MNEIPKTQNPDAVTAAASASEKSAASTSADRYLASFMPPPQPDHSSAGEAKHAEMSSAKAPTSFPGDTNQPQSDADKFVNSPEQRSAQAGGSAVLDALGVIPVVGTVTGGLSALYDVGHAVTDPEHAEAHFAEAALDAVSTIPIVGQVLSATALVWDVSVGQQRQSGVSNADAPTLSEAWVKGVDGYILDIVGPGSSPPRPPKQTEQ